jgi:single-stranded-DNA-specific exonuclease
LSARGITSPAAWRQWQDSQDRLSAPETLVDLSRACGILTDAVRREVPIRVFGDYDADGVTATALMVRALAAAGAHVDWRVPNRFDDGYGLSVDAVRDAAAQGVAVLVTVDCGSSSPDAATEAAAAGVTLIVTDHHRLPEVWPEAACLINPERMSPKPVLSGAGVALQLARGLLGDGVPAACWALAAVGSIADVMPLTGETRAIVRRGLEALRAGAAPGLTAILRRAGRDPSHVTSEDVAFAVAPRLNAAGRMGRPETAVEAGLADGEEAAGAVAEELEEANHRRRVAAAAVVESVEAQLADRGPETAFLVAVGDGWHEGVIGIAAARAAERFRKPVAVITFQGEVGKGSARGGGFGDVLGALREHGECFLRLGGHFGAAGFTISRDKAKDLEARLSEAWVRHARPAETEPPWPAKPDELTEAAGRWLDAMEPFGPGWPRPRFVVTGEVRAVERMGRTGAHVRVGLTGCTLSTVCFDAGRGAGTWTGRRFTGVGTLRPHWWNGECRYQIYWDEVRAPARDVAPLSAHTWQVGAPPRTRQGVLVLGRRRAPAQQNAEEAPWAVWSWWRDPPPASRDERWAAAYIVEPPPHRWALQAALAFLKEGATVYWHPRALDAGRAVREWARRVPDRARLLRLWQARRAGLSPLLPGRRILDELGLGDGRHPGRKVALEASLLFRTAWRERRQGESDWARGGPFAWREEEQRGLAD